MAELFLAKRRGVEGFEKTLAIKRILPELSWNREFVSMFINEAKIAARLSHPNIVQIFDFGKIDNYYFIAMEYVHGENLRALLQRSEQKQIPLSADLAAFITARACAGLDHAHRKTDETGRPLRIVHRDVSPQNVLVSYDGDVKVVDFGIAKAVAENPEATRGVLKGKLAYLSPEQVQGVSLDARSDIFAIGLVLYELLAGKKLFTQPDPAEVLDSIVHVNADEVARSLTHVDRTLRDVLRRALAPDPENRFRSAGEMQIALEEYLRASGDPGGTMQLTNLMRLLFDEKVGEHTSQILRSQLLARPARVPRSAVRSGSSKRLVAALGGAALGLIALLIASPKLRASTPQPKPVPPASRPQTAAPESPPSVSRAAPPPAAAPAPREEAPAASVAPPEVAKAPAPNGLADARTRYRGSRRKPSGRGDRFVRQGLCGVTGSARTVRGGICQGAHRGR